MISLLPIFFYFYKKISSFADSCFVVQVAKGPRGLGLSVCGGIETNAAFRGVIRIKRLFPNQSAWCTGMLQPGDILLEANGTRLTGLTNHVILFGVLFTFCQFPSRFIIIFLVETWKKNFIKIHKL